MAETNANENEIADGIPMTLEQMREYLQDYYGIPIALREQGVTTVTCPYCLKVHEHGFVTRHQEALCENPEMALVIGMRNFIPSYGYTIMEYYVNGHGVKELTVPDNLLNLAAGAQKQSSMSLSSSSSVFSDLISITL